MDMYVLHPSALSPMPSMLGIRNQKSDDCSTDTPTLGFSNFLAPSTATVKYSYPKPGNYSSEIKSLQKTLSLDHMKDFLKSFTSLVPASLSRANRKRD